MRQVQITVACVLKVSRLAGNAGRTAVKKRTEKKTCRLCECVNIKILYKCKNGIQSSTFTSSKWNTYKALVPQSFSVVDRKSVV